MRRQHDIVELAQRMIERQRFLRKRVEARACDLLALKGVQQRSLVDDGTTCGIHEITGWLHACEIARTDQPACALAEDDVDGDDVGVGEQLILGRIGHACGGAGLRRQVLAPCDHIHAERLGNCRDFLAELAETDDAKRHAFDILSHGGLPQLARMHARILEADFPRQFQHQPDGEARGGIADAARAAHRDAALFRGLKVERGIAHAGCQKQFEFGQRGQDLARKRCALAHGADDFEVLQGADRFVLRGEWLVEHRDADPVVERRPVGEFQSDVLVVVENGDAMHSGLVMAGCSGRVCWRGGIVNSTPAAVELDCIVRNDVKRDHTDHARQKAPRLSPGRLIAGRENRYTMPSARMDSATRMKPATLAPST